MLLSVVLLLSIANHFTVVLITAQQNILSKNFSFECDSALTKNYEPIYNHGDKYFFMNRDRYLWDHRIMHCFRRVANETVVRASRTPAYYCYGDVHGAHQTTVLGACFPAQCYSDRHKLLHEYKNRLGLWKSNPPVEDLYCIRSRRMKAWFESPLPVLDFFVNKLLMLFVCFATLYQMCTTQPPKSLCGEILLAFSAAKNVKKFVPKQSKNSIRCIDGLRVPSALWVVIGHSFWILQDFLGNVEQYKNEIGINFWAQWITNFLLSVDTFFTLSGVLTSYHWFLRLKKTGEDVKWNSWNHWLQFYRHRLFRLWPAYMYVLWLITISMSKYSYFILFPPTNPAIQCVTHWWENVLLINSLTSNKCIGWTWYISASFIFHLVSPVFLLAFKRSLRCGLVLATCITLLSSLLNIIQIYRYNYPPTQMLFVQPVIYNQNYYEREITMYIGPQYRIGPYLTGLCLGYILSELNSIKSPKTATWMVVGGWLCAAVFGLGSLFGLYPALQGWDWPVYNLLYGGFHRTLWSLSIAWIIFACHTGLAGPISIILHCPLFAILAPLCYSVYLIHMVPVLTVFTLSTFPLHYRGILQILGYCGIQIFGTFIIAFTNVMLIEFPANNLELVFFHSRATKPAPLTSANNPLASKSIEEGRC